MLTRNDPRAVSAEAVECFLAGCNDGRSSAEFRMEVLRTRHHLTPGRAALIAALAFKEARDAA